MGEVDLAAVIMAGGSGTRFWPLSQKDFPKQYLSLFGQQSLIQQTVSRIVPLIPHSNVFICSAQNQESLLKTQLPSIKNLILEPEGKNTAPCLMLSALNLKRANFPKKGVMVVLPADHFISNSDAFLKTIRQAVQCAKESERLITLGIRPDSPHTGYGYIEAGHEISSQVLGLFEVERFVEKPNSELAKQFVAKGNFFWNSGIFVWTLGAIIKAFEASMPETWSALQHFTTARDLQSVYRNLPSVSIDVGILEKADNLAMVPANFPWSDVGSWDALYHLRTKDLQQNVVMQGDLKALEATGCLVNLPGKKVALVGCRDLIVVENNGMLLIADRKQDQKVREISKAFDAPP